MVLSTASIPVRIFAIIVVGKFELLLEFADLALRTVELGLQVVQVGVLGRCGLCVSGAGRVVSGCSRWWAV